MLLLWCLMQCRQNRQLTYCLFCSHSISLLAKQVIRGIHKSPAPDKTPCRWFTGAWVCVMAEGWMMLCRFRTDCFDMCNRWKYDRKHQLASLLSTSSSQNNHPCFSPPPFLLTPVCFIPVKVSLPPSLFPWISFLASGGVMTVRMECVKSKKEHEERSCWGRVGWRVDGS